MKAKRKTKNKQTKKATVLGRSNWRRQAIFKLHVSVRLINGSYGEKGSFGYTVFPNSQQNSVSTVYRLKQFISSIWKGAVTFHASNV